MKFNLNDKHFADSDDFKAVIISAGEQIGEVLSETDIHAISHSVWDTCMTGKIDVVYLHELQKVTNYDIGRVFAIMSDKMCLDKDHLTICKLLTVLYNIVK